MLLTIRVGRLRPAADVRGTPQALARLTTKIKERIVSLFTPDIPSYLKSGEPARLIPVTKGEVRLTSCTLATLRSVKDFAKNLLRSIDVSCGLRTKIECFTEVVFENNDSLRPDGLIVVTNGNKQWRALIEAKIDRWTLDSEQITDYINLARDNGIDAVITISNQYTAKPTHHPVWINRNKAARSIKLYHWSWTYIFSEAVRLVSSDKLSDSEQTYMLNELIRYLEHPNTGVRSFDSMDSSWKSVCDDIHTGVRPKRSDVNSSVESWHEFVRYISLDLSLALREDVRIFLGRAQQNNSKLRVDDDASQLISKHILRAKFDVPDAASRIRFHADLKARSVSVYMYLLAPKERTTSKGRINWFRYYQLDKTTKPEKIFMRAVYPGRIPSMMASLSEIRERGSEILIHNNTTSLPVGFDIGLTQDLSSRFSGPKTFVQTAAPLLREFYEQAGQHLRKWTPPPPKVKKENKDILPKDEPDEVEQGRTLRERLGLTNDS